MFCNLNGKILKESNGFVSINNRSFRYGDGCFETMKFLGGKLLLEDFHFQRLFSSLETLQFDCPNFFTTAYLQEQVYTLVKKNQHQKLARIRLTVFRGNGGLYDAENMRPNWLIQSWTLNPESNTINSNGLVLGIYEDGFKAADALANIKSNNYLLYAMAALHAKRRHWNDALVLNHRLSVADATIANLFLVRKKVVFTPPLSDGPVAGVMRHYLLQELPKHGFTIEEKSITAGDIEAADEAFLSNGIFGIKWIQSIGDKQFRLQHSAAIHKNIIAPLFEQTGTAV